MSGNEAREARFSSELLGILSALSAPERLKILLALESGGLSYSELMKTVGMSRRRDLGRFSYHLRRLLEVGLVEVDRESRLYRLSSAGFSVIELLRNLSLRVDLGGGLFVRRWLSVVEPFDKLRIIDSLVREAGVPVRVASRVAGRVEDELVRLGLGTVDSPVVRCLVGYELLNRGLLGHLSRYVQVGPSLYDVSGLFRRSLASGDSLVVEDFVDDVLGGFVFRRLFPRGLAEFCYGGVVGVYRPGSWVNAFLGFGLLSDGGIVGVDGLMSLLVRSRVVRDELVVGGREVSWEVVDKFVDLLRSVRCGRVGYSVCSSAGVFVGRGGFPSEFVRAGDLMCSFSLLGGSFAVSRLVDDCLLFDSFGLFGLGGSLSVFVGGLFGVNLAGLFLRSDGRLDLVLQRLREVLRQVVQAVLKRHGFLGRMHRDLGGGSCYYLVAPVGLREVLDRIVAERSLGEALGFFRDVLSVFRDVLSGSSGRRVRVSVASVWPRDLSEFLYQRDGASFGSQTVARFVGPAGVYSDSLFGFSSPIFREGARDVAMYFDSGLVVPVDFSVLGQGGSMDELLGLFETIDNLVLRFRRV
ncbi:MAG: winged helix-turn-helix domain-containing protein [Nitrososphaerota archaeon]